MGNRIFQSGTLGNLAKLRERERVRYFHQYYLNLFEGNCRIVIENVFSIQSMTLGIYN